MNEGNVKINVLCELVKAVSKKGSEYEVLELTFDNGYKKRVFLDSAENYMINSLVKGK